MQRLDIVKTLMSQIGKDDIVVASTGLISREVFFVKDRALNFYMQGSMGNALGIGIGLAMHLKNNVIVISGDGSALMGLGSMVTANKLKLPNLRHYILDNNCHESTGWQGTSSDAVNFERLAPNTHVCTIEKSQWQPPRITLSPKQITRRFKDAIICQQQKQAAIK